MTHQPTETWEGLLWNLDLSKSSSLRSLEIAVILPSILSTAALNFLGDLFSTITSPVFSDLVIVLQSDCVSIYNRRFRQVLFGLLRGMYEVKPFRLIFCLESQKVQDHTMAEFKREIDAEVVEGGLDFLPCPPVVVSHTRTTRSSEWETLRVYGP